MLPKMGGLASPCRRTFKTPMKPQARPFTVEIKRSKRPVHSSAGTLPSFRLDDRSLQERPARDTPPDDTSQMAASGATLSEADLVFGRLLDPMPVATVALDGLDPSKSARPEGPARSKAAATSPTLSQEGHLGDKRRQGRILPDLVSAARKEERAREAQAFASPRLPGRPRTRALPETVEIAAIKPEDTTRSRRTRKAGAGVERPREAVPSRPEVAALVALPVASGNPRHQPSPGISQAERCWPRDGWWAAPSKGQARGGGRSAQGGRAMEAPPPARVPMIEGLTGRSATAGVAGGAGRGCLATHILLRPRRPPAPCQAAAFVRGRPRRFGGSPLWPSTSTGSGTGAEASPPPVATASFRRSCPRPIVLASSERCLA